MFSKYVVVATAEFLQNDEMHIGIARCFNGLSYSKVTAIRV